MDLFEPVELRGGVRLNNRIAMAPMTRARSGAGDTPSPYAAEYYGQRATAGLVITEGTIISPVAKGYSLTPGIFTDEQERAWGEVTARVHQVEGAKVFCQLWHVGRISHEEISGHQPLGPSAVRPPIGQVWLEREDGWRGNIDCGEPRAMEHADIAATVEDYRAAAERAVRCGFDGVEIHAANGYLIDQFMRATTNHRTDQYGGDVDGRLRFLREVVAAVVAEVGPERVGVRFSPIVNYGDTDDAEIEATVLAAAQWLDAQQIAYLHVVEADNQDMFGDSERRVIAMSIPEDFRADLRKHFAGPLMLAYRYDRERAEAVLSEGAADLFAIGRPFIANPDLVARLRDGVDLAESDTSTWYGGGEAGYTDYPVAAADSLS